VTLGSVDRASSPTNSVTQVTHTKVVHENYQETNLNFDVALLKLDSPVAFNSGKIHLIDKRGVLKKVIKIILPL
jgi:hypothetical protein